MNLKAPEGVGEPCVAGVAIVARDGRYEVDAEVAALLIECFGFVEVVDSDKPHVRRLVRRSRPAAKQI
jgi:hypothetical protein